MKHVIALHRDTRRIFTFFFPFIFFFLHAEVNGQKEFAPIGATWYYAKIETLVPDENVGYIKVVSQKDTIIENKRTKVLSQVNYRTDGQKIKLENFYVHQSGDSISYWLDGDFRLFYDFSLEKGDTLSIYSKELFCEQGASHYGKLLIDSVKSETINGVKLKKFTTSPLMNSDSKYGAPHMELIGNLYGIHPSPNCTYYDIIAEIGDLRCYIDPTYGKFHFSFNSEFINCDSLITDIKSEPQINRMKVRYHANVKTFSLDFSELDLIDAFQVNVYDIKGATLFSKTYQPSTHNIDIPVLYKGLYFLQIINNQNIMYNEKLLAY